MKRNGIFQRQSWLRLSLTLAACATTAIFTAFAADADLERARKDPEAAYQLGLSAWLAGDERKAVSFLRNYAADKNHREALHTLGSIYSVKDSAGDQKLGFGYYKKAADALPTGLAEAQFKVGMCYEQGWLGQRQNSGEAVRYYEMAARQKYAPAMSRLGLLLHEGKLVEKDSARAVEYAKQAADEGLVEAQFTLGELGRLGQLVKGDKLENAMETYKWYLIAARSGHPEAEKQLKERRSLDKLSPANLAEAGRRAEQFITSHAARTSSGEKR